MAHTGFQPSVLMNKIKNTSNPMDPIDAMSMLLAGSSVILAQEARGQSELVQSTVLPNQGLLQLQPLLNHFGFKVGDTVKDDALFREVTFPEGWKLVPSDHSMWSHLADPQGNFRAAIFYKAAFYDRSAHISPVARFTATSKMVSDDADEWYPAVVDSVGKVMWAGPVGAYESAKGKADVILAATTFDKDLLDWTVPVEFPASEYVEPPGTAYKFETVYLSDGQVVDRGVTTSKCKDDAAAIALMEKRGARSSYDVAWTIMDGDRVVAKKTFESESTRRRNQAKKFRRVDFDSLGRPIERDL